MTDQPNVTQAMPFQRGYQSQAPGFSEWQLNPMDILELIEHMLRGHYWEPSPGGGHDNQQFGKWITEKNEDKEKATKVIPLVNEKGIHAILTDIHGVVHRVVIMSNWNERQLQDWLQDLAYELNDAIFYNYDNWDVETIPNYNMIHKSVMIPVEAAMRRALLEGERKRLYEAVKTVEQRTITDQQKTGSPLSWIPGLGGRGGGT
jgi:hypothetical protein